MIPIFNLLTQYTGTGARIYFEYGFELFPEQTVLVLVNGVPVAFVRQDLGVVIEPAPALNATILIYRQTDVTQLEDYQPFESFDAAKTEWSCDKLIMLKQEALIYRAQLNLYSDPYVDRVILVNDKGTDAVIYLWDQNEAGMFAGEVGELPNVGSFVAKPENFAYFSCGGGEPPPEGFQTYEHVLFATNEDYLVRNIGIDYVNDEWTDFGSFYLTYPGIVSDGNVVIASGQDGTAGDFYLYRWRGTCFTRVHFEDLGFTNTTKDMELLYGLNNQFVAVGVLGFSAGLAVINYAIAPADLTLAYTSSPSGSEQWNGSFDLRYGNSGTPERGDALFIMGTGSTFSTYAQSGGILVRLGQSSTVVNRSVVAFAVDRDSGWVGYRDTNINKIVLYKINMLDLSMSPIGTIGDTVDQVYSISFVPGTDGAMLLIYEHTGGINDYYRTYSRDGLVLTMLNEFAVSVRSNSSARFYISPFSNQIWHQGVSGFSDLLTVAPDGTIAIVFSLPLTGGSSGSTPPFMAFLKDQMTVYPNGFLGIKAKLFQCWEMEETGNNPRVYSFTDSTAELVSLTKVGSGNLTRVASDVGFAVKFDGNSGLLANCTTEMGTTGTFSMCIDVTLDNKTNDQAIVVRALNGWTTAVPEEQDFGLRYDQATDRFVFWTVWGTTLYSVAATDVGVIATGTKYHIYVEFNKLEAKNKIRVNGGTLFEVASNTNINRNSTAHVHVGLRTTVAILAQYLSGSADQFFWFWDALTTAEQDFMYNSGNSRAFSEL